MILGYLFGLGTPPAGGYLTELVVAVATKPVEISCVVERVNP